MRVLLMASCLVTNHSKLSDLNRSLYYPSLGGPGRPGAPSKLGGSGPGSLYRTARGAQQAGWLWPRVPAGGCTQDAAGPPASCWACPSQRAACPGSRPLHTSLHVLSTWQSEHGGVGSAWGDPVPRVAHSCLIVTTHQKPGIRDFAGGPGAKAPHSECRRPGFDPWSRN